MNFTTKYCDLAALDRFHWLAWLTGIEIASFTGMMQDNYGYLIRCSGDLAESWIFDEYAEY